MYFCCGSFSVYRTVSSQHGVVNFSITPVVNFSVDFSKGSLAESEEEIILDNWLCFHLSRGEKFWNLERFPCMMLPL